jgi:hypothetical protein
MHGMLRAATVVTVVAAALSIALWGADSPVLMTAGHPVAATVHTEPELAMTRIKTAVPT